MERFFGWASVRRSKVSSHQQVSHLTERREIIGDRFQAEIDYDNSVVAHLSAWMDIKRAIRAVNQEYPEEALKPGADQWSDLAARYNYIREHKTILKRLGMSE